MYTNFLFYKFITSIKHILNLLYIYICIILAEKVILFLKNEFVTDNITVQFVNHLLVSWL